MTPKQAKAARLILCMSIDYVCERIPIGRRTITEFEAGNRTINMQTAAKIEAFYLINGITFRSSEEEDVIFMRKANLETEIGKNTSSGYFEYPHYLALDKFLSYSEEMLILLAHMKTSLPFCSKLIVDFLKRTGTFQKTLAGNIGCSLAFLNAVINGKKRISQPMAKKLYPYIDIDLSMICLYEKRIEDNIRIIESNINNIKTNIKSTIKQFERE